MKRKQEQLRLDDCPNPAWQFGHGEKKTRQPIPVAFRSSPKKLHTTVCQKETLDTRVK